MLIVLFRHGPAGSADPARWPDDAQRPLTAKGEERTRQSALGLHRLLDAPVAMVMTSPLLRAAATARIVAQVTAAAQRETVEALAPGGSFRKTLASLAPLADAEVVVLVGHEPDLGKLAGVLLFGAPSALPLKKAGACAIECDGEPQPGRGVLRWLAPPRLLRRVAGKKTRA